MGPKRLIAYYVGVSAAASLAESFIASVKEEQRAPVSSAANLEQRLAGMLAEARAAWPKVVVSPELFVGYVAQRLPDAGDVLEALASLRIPDLYLACACAHGDTRALAEFDARYVTEIDAALGRMRQSRATVDEVKQLVRQKLFVRVGDKPGKIAAYAGKGGLHRWVRAVAVRTCLNQMRKGKREVLVENNQVLAGVSAAGDDPELAYMKEKYRHEFRASFQEALGMLVGREQGLLRYHYVDGLNIDEIGTIYRVHRVTAYRWLEKARETLVAKTLGQLKARLNVENKEFDSILRMIRSQLHLSLVRYLGGEDKEE